MDTLRNVPQQGLGDLCIGGILLLLDGDHQLQGLRIDITDINATLVGEQDLITLIR